MKTRSWIAATAVATLTFTACGGDSGPKRLSEDDFTDQLSEICSDTNKDMDKIQARDMGDYPDFADAAGDAIDVLTDTREQLSKITPPESLADDLDDFIGVVDDQIDAFGAFQKAAQDKDDDAMQAASDDLDDLSTKGDDIAGDLGVDDCISQTDDTTDTSGSTVPATSEPSSAAETTVALTLPETVPPQTVPETIAPETTTPVTEASGQLFTVVDLTTVFSAPDGFSLVNSDPAVAQTFIDLVAAVPALNTGIQEMGVGVLLDSTGAPIATIVVGVAIGDAMPGEWKDMLCADGVLRTSDAGYTGVACPGGAGTGVSDIFTMTDGDVGLSVASVVDTVPADLVVDAFFEANFQ